MDEPDKRSSTVTTEAIMINSPMSMDEDSKISHNIQKPTFQRLSGQELLSLRRKNTTLPVRGEKDFAPNNSPWQQYRLQEAYTSQKELLSEERGARLGSVAQAVWHPAQGAAEITILKGKFWLTMGHHKNGKKWLFPEEALFLMDMGSLELYYNSVALSVQEAYSMVIPFDIPLDYYQVYSHMLRLGYIVKRHQGSQFSKHERAIRIDRYQPKRSYSPFWNLSSQPESSESYEPGSTSSDYDGKCFRNHTDLSLSTGSSENSPQSSLDESDSDTEDMALSSGSSSYLSDGPIIPILPQKPQPEPEVKEFSVDLLAFKRKMEKQGSAKSDQKGRKRIKLQTDKQRTNVKSHISHAKETSVVPKEKDCEKEKPKCRKRSKSWEQTGTKRDTESSDSSDKSMLSNAITLERENLGNESSSVDINDVFDVFRDLVKAQSVCKPQLAINCEQHSSCVTKYSKWNFSQLMFPNLAENIPMSDLPTLKQGLLPDSIETATHNKMQMDTSNVLKLQQLMRMSNEVMKTSETIVRMSQNVCDSMKAMGSMDDEQRVSRASESQPVSTQPLNWAEYKKLQKESKEVKTSDRPTGYFRGNKIQPLVRPQDAHSTGALLEKLKIIQNVNLCGNRKSKLNKSLPVHIAFDVYLPDYGYKKTAPGKPHLSVCVMNHTDKPPGLHTIAAVMSQCQGVPLLWAVLDNADITFFVFHDINLPNDISLG